MKLVIVESPAKAKTIGKFLGEDYVVRASYGHVRDLPDKAEEIPEEYRNRPWAKLGVDVENQFQPIYVITDNSKRQIAELRKLLKNADEVVLATDEDREGEAISWHLVEVLKPKVATKRIVFHEITKEAIDEAIAHPRGINDALVRAQETRRILDRLVGYSLSPVLWKKVRSGLSAGRVQSVALRLVVEREEERRAFKKAAYWDLTAALEADGIAFEATLTQLGGRRIASGKDFDDETGQLKTPDAVLLGEAEALQVAEALKKHPWEVSQIEQKETRQRPQPPFITSTLQQAASSLLGMSPKQTMKIAQQLYEGVDLGQGEREGVITYMRTDSVVLSEKALAEAAAYIRKHFGDSYHRRMQYTTKSKMAQEAHEAIRPTHISRTPKDLAPYLKSDELKLYRLIWNRTVSSQMAEAQLLKTTIDFTAEADGQTATLRANGSVVVFPGFLKVADTAQEDAKLPRLIQGDFAVMADAENVAPGHRVLIRSITPARHETKPPARYTEASLVRRLEEEGIGRPSTYASTVGTIEERGYVYRRGKALVPTYLGIAVIHLLRKHFAEYVDLKFTARMEDTLDKIADGEQSWLDFLHMFYFGNGDFGHGLAPRIAAELKRIEYPAIPVGESDGQPIVVRVGKNGPYLQRGQRGKGNTANLPADLPYDELSVDRAATLLAQRAQGPRPLGVDPATGRNVYVLNGPYGPYVQLGERGQEGGPIRRVSLLKGTSIESVTLEIALEYLKLPRTLGMHPEKDKPVQAAIGRYGPYVVCDGDFRSIQQPDSVFTITLERALELLAQPGGARRGRTLLRELGTHPESGNTVALYAGRYGLYVSDGTLNATLPKDTSPDTVSLEQAVALLAEAATRPRGARRTAKRAPKRAAAKTAPKKKAAAKRKKTP